MLLAGRAVDVPRQSVDRHSDQITDIAEWDTADAGFVRYWPFGVVAILGQMGALWPPGPSNISYYLLSTVLLAVTVVALTGVPAYGFVPVAAVYFLSVAFLILGAGGINSGLGPLLMVPVVLVSLYGRPWESGLVTAGLIGPLIGVSMASSNVSAATGRRVVLFLCVATMVSVSGQALRMRLRASVGQIGGLLHQAEMMNAAARALSSLLDTPAITATGSALAAQIASLPGAEVPSSTYLRIDDDLVVVDPEPVEGDPVVPAAWGLAELPPLESAVRGRRPVVAALDRDGSGFQQSPWLTDPGITHGAWVPVCPDGSLHGVLTVMTRGVPVPPQTLERLAALGHMMELALSNWTAHERLEQQATADERRRIARELHDGLAHELAFIASRARRSTRTGGSDEDLKQLVHAADRALDEARRAITVLSNSRRQSLTGALAETAEDLGARLGVPVVCDLAADVEMPGETTENLLRIAREAITNAACHGQPNLVTVRLDESGGVRMAVEDDGCGFDPDGPATGGFGLMSMEERAASIGARFRVDSAPGKGTRVEVALP